MKKLLLGSLILTIFSISILIFQLSCTKSSWAKDVANSNVTTCGNGKLVLYVDHNTQAVSNPRTFWLMDSNGGNRRKINIVFPSAEYNIENGRLVDNGTKLIFSATKVNETEQIDIMFKCNLDGTGLTELFKGKSFINVYEISDSY